MLGAAGGIGQPLSLLLKLNPRVSELALYDIRGGPGVAADISHINTKSTVTGHEPTPSGLKEALSGAEIVLIPAGVPRKPGMTRDGTSSPSAFRWYALNPGLHFHLRPFQHQCFYRARSGQGDRRIRPECQRPRHRQPRTLLAPRSYSRVKRIHLLTVDGPPGQLHRPNLRRSLQG